MIPGLARMLLPFLLAIPFATRAQDNLLLFAPHPDDEVLMIGGVISNALDQGHNVRVAIVTNGSLGGTPDLRIRESLRTLVDVLRVSRSRIHFLGYSDGTLQEIARSLDETDIFASSSGRVQTYGSSVNDVVDYHYEITSPSVHGDCNRATLTGDLERLIETDYPEQIFLPVLYDDHPDHWGAGRLVIDALLNVKRRTAGVYSPKLFWYLVHDPGCSVPDECWPVRTNPRDECIQSQFFHPLVSALLEQRAIESRSVSCATQGKKFAAILQYSSQSSSFNDSFVKAEEFFWTHAFDSLSYTETAVYTSSEDGASGQLGTSAIDGVVDGYPDDTRREWATENQTAGAWIRLEWEEPHVVNTVILHDRKNGTDQVLAARLSFSSGDEVAVGPLSNDGSGDVVQFSPRSVRYVQLTIDSAAGTNTGLAEFEVLFVDPDDPDRDGLSNDEESVLGTNPDLFDTDGDGLGDGEEVGGPDGLPSTGDETDPLLVDTDADGTHDALDNCPIDANAEQEDRDADTVGDICDNCAETVNPSQRDRGGLGAMTSDGVGDLCQNADFNEDGGVDVLDVTVLRRNMADLGPTVDPAMPPTGP